MPCNFLSFFLFFSFCGILVCFFLLRFFFFNDHSETHSGGRPWYSAAKVRVERGPHQGLRSQNWAGELRGWGMGREAVVGAVGQGEEEPGSPDYHSDGRRGLPSASSSPRARGWGQGDREKPHLGIHPLLQSKGRNQRQQRPRSPRRGPRISQQVKQSGTPPPFPSPFDKII